MDLTHYVKATDCITTIHPPTIVSSFKPARLYPLTVIEPALLPQFYLCGTSWYCVGAAQLLVMLSFTDTVNPGRKAIPCLLQASPAPRWHLVPLLAVVHSGLSSLPSISPAGWSPSGPDEKGRIAPHEPKRQPLIEVSGGWLVQSSCL